MNQLELEIETLKQQLAEAKAEITFLKTEMIVLGNGYKRPEYKTCKHCESKTKCYFNPYKKGAPYCRRCMEKLYGDFWEYDWYDMLTEKYNKEKPENVFEYEDEDEDEDLEHEEEDKVEEVDEDDEEDDKEDDEEDDEEEEEVEDRRQTHTVKEPWKSMMTEYEEEEDADNMAQAEYQRKYCDENGQEYDDECWYESPIKTITVKQMMLALDKLPRNAQLVITEDGYYSDTEFAKMMLPEPYTIKNKIPRLPDGTQVYRIGHSYQHYGKQYWEKYWEK
jgi:Nucleosome binding factor SPN, SPT16 subunit